MNSNQTIFHQEQKIGAEISLYEHEFMQDYVSFTEAENGTINCKIYAPLQIFFHKAMRDLARQNGEEYFLELDNEAQTKEELDTINKMRIAYNNELKKRFREAFFLFRTSRKDTSFERLL